jgi:phosphoribosylformimino-5-aminoimidazole carboxamide ribotide isomerase
MRFRPCIDLHHGRVVQIVGASLRDDVEHVVTNFVTDQSPAHYARQYQQDRLRTIHAVVGCERLVLDLSCRYRANAYWIVSDRWQRFTTVTLSAHTLARLAEYCAEFLVHGVDVEGQRLGIDGSLVELLGEISPIPITYAGGAQSLQDLELVKQLGGGRVDLSIGSALDIFGGLLSYRAVVAWQRREEQASYQ